MMIVHPLHYTYGKQEVEIADPGTTGVGGSGLEPIVMIDDHRQRRTIGTFPRQGDGELWPSYYARCRAAAIDAWQALYDPCATLPEIE